MGCGPPKARANIIGDDFNLLPRFPHFCFPPFEIQASIHHNAHPPSDGFGDVLSQLAEAHHVKKVRLLNRLFALAIAVVPGNAQIGYWFADRRLAYLWVAGYVPHYYNGVIKCHNYYFSFSFCRN